MKKLFSIFSLPLAKSASWRTKWGQLSILFFFLFFSLVILSINYTPVIYHFLITPPDRVHTGTVFFSDDYAVYTSVIQQGIDGNLGVVNKYTSELHSPSLLRSNYLLLGKIGGTLGLSSIITYHLSRLALGIIFLLLCLYLILNFVPKNLQRLSFLFLLFSYSWPKFDLASPILWLKITPLFTEPNPIVRFATHPHFQIGAIYSVVAIIFFLSLLTIKNGLQVGKRVARVERLPTARSNYEHWREGNPRQDPPLNEQRPTSATLKIVLFLIFTTFATLTDPAQVLVIHFALFLFIFYLAFQNLIKKVPIPSLKKIFITLFLTISCSLLPYFYLRYISSQEPWVHIFPPFENMQIFPQTFPDFFLSFGPIALFATLGILAFFLSNLPRPKILNSQTSVLSSPCPSEPWRRREFLILSFLWLLSALILIFFLAGYLQINRLRLFHTPLYIPLAILAAYGISSLANLLARIHFKTSCHSGKRSVYPVKILFTWASRITSSFFLAFIILALSAPLTFSSFMEQVKFLSETDSALIYPPKTHVEAYNFLRQNTDRSDIVICLYEACNQIPYFSGNTVFLGNITETLSEGSKNKLAREIFSGSLSADKLKGELSINRIAYLFLGYQEAFWQTDFGKYPFLEKVFQNRGASIWKIKL